MTEQLTETEERAAGGISAYLQATQAELKKVVWPTREQAINLTVVVLTVVVIMTSILWGIDVVFSQFFKLFLG